MLNKDVLMQDIDVAQWRNAQTMLLDSAKARPRIVVLHDNGRVRKVAHSRGLPVSDAPSRIESPQAAAEALFNANADDVDFVAVFERRAFDAYFAAVQDSWDIDEDLDAFVQRTYALLENYPDGMLTYPQSARTTLGLQWRLGASREQVAEAARAFAEPGSTIVLGVFDGGELWASLVLSFGEDGSITSVTTANSEVVDLAGDRQRVAERVVAWVEAEHGSCSLGVFADRPFAEEFLQSADKVSALRQAVSAGTVLLSPAPAALTAVLA
jgi:hypothetical protein